jgi:trehalose-phosphatase
MAENPRLTAIAHAPLLLVACDFDGTVAPIVTVPEEAAMDARCRAALAALGRLPCTSVALISGRPMAWLRSAAGTLPDPLLYGSHGAESGHGASKAPRAGRVSRITSRLKSVVPRWPGAHVEEKPFGAALHYRRASPTVAGDVTDVARAIASEFVGVVVKLGSMVVELTTSAEHKGDALRAAKQRSGATHAVFFGDDVTDEDAFGELGEADLGVKVGPGPTKADVRVRDVAEVAAMLEAVCEQRRAYLDARRPVPLQAHSVLSDFRTVAVVGPSANIAWLCLPRIDSPALFAGLLGDAAGGEFSVAPGASTAPPVQRYLGDSMVLESRWPTVTLLDYLDCSSGRPSQRAGRSDLVRVLSGTGVVRVVFAPRVDFGRLATSLRASAGAVEIADASDPTVLVSPGVVWTVRRDGVHDTAEALIDLELTGPVALELRYGTHNREPSIIPEPERRRHTEALWSGWSRALTLPLLHADAVKRSALMLKALTHGPTGALLAAATTSLPEQVGGCRNWDYRFCWPRDAAMAATALLRLGSSYEAMRLAEWLVGIIDRLESPERLRPLYSVTGGDLSPEAQINELRGYAESRPVRVSNAAAHQVQLDVFGPIADMLATMAERGVPISPDYWRLAKAIVAAVEARWMEPDHGIWEIRGPKRHHVHSRLMCWHAVDRCLTVQRAVLGKPNADWERLRAVIASDVLNHGWDRRTGAFTAAYGEQESDAATLLIGLTGLLPPDDPRWLKTVEVVRRDLGRGSTVLRYRCDDGLPGREGGFIICACWLVEALASIGRVDEARSLLDSIVAQAGPTGVFTEQHDDWTGAALGNLPQAYSHLGVINAVLRLDGGGSQSRAAGGHGQPAKN